MTRRGWIGVLVAGVAAVAAAGVAWLAVRGRAFAGRADLSRYRAENARLPAPAPGEARVVFIGDSITDFWGRDAGSFFPGQPFVNRGISGEQTPQMLQRFAADVIGLRPRAVVIHGGTNDIAVRPGVANLVAVQQNLAAMAERAQSNGILVVLASLLPVHDRSEPRSASRPAASLLAVNAWLRQHAQQRGFVYLDYHAAMVEPDGSLRASLSGDGLHPNAAGYAVMQPLAQEAIDTALRLP